MQPNPSSAEQLHHIKNMMERSSRFISLSGLSGVGAGICAIAGAWYASGMLECHALFSCSLNDIIKAGGYAVIHKLLWIAAFTFAAAFISAFLFTWSRSKKLNTPIMSSVTYRLFTAMAIPLAAGAVFLLRLIHLGMFDMISPGSLIFYGLALISASRYTVREIKYLGYAILMIGVVNLYFAGYGIFFWILGFGILHIVYGIVMWWKYEKDQPGSTE